MPEISSSKYVVQAHRDIWHRPDRVKKCVRCGESKPLCAFYAYAYKTTQGKPGTRYESRCRPCAQARRKEQIKDNPQLVQEQNRKRYEGDPNWARDQARKYRSTEHGRVVKARIQRLRKARMRAQSGDDAEIRAIYAEAMRIEKIVACCPVFDIPELGKKMHVDHIRPLARGGKHVASNLQILPIGINMRKGVKCQR